MSCARHEKRFDRLVLVAPPAAFGELRKLLLPELERIVIGEISKDLTRASPAELARHLGAVMPV